MLHVFSIIYLIAIVFVDCDNIYFLQNLSDINELTAVLFLAFLCMVFVRRNEKEGCGAGILSASLILLLLYSALSFYFSLNADLSLYPALRSLIALFLTLALIFYLKDIETLKKRTNTPSQNCTV